LEQRNITLLSGLDLAGLLRVLDQNWYQISNSLDFTPEARYFVKEMQTIRNWGLLKNSSHRPVALNRRSGR